MGWRTESQMSSYPYNDDDLVIRDLTDIRRQLRSHAGHLARLLHGNTFEQTESDGQLQHRDRIVRFIIPTVSPRRRRPRLAR